MLFLCTMRLTSFTTEKNRKTFLQAGGCKTLFDILAFRESFDNQVVELTVDAIAALSQQSTVGETSSSYTRH